MPTAVKDPHPTAGVRTTFGSPVWDDHVPDVSDAVVLAMEAAGLVGLGKTSIPALGSPCYTEPEDLPPAVTPYDPGRMAGGSSGGAPAYADPIGLATAGQIARPVRDAAALLDVLAGRLPGDPAWAPSPSGTFLDACDREPRVLRVARFCEPVIAEAEVHPVCRAAWEDASCRLEELGHEVVDVPSPLPRDAVADFETCWAVLAALSPVPPGRANLLRPLTRWLREPGEDGSGPGFALAIGALRRHAAAALTALGPFDAVLTPTLAAPPPPVGAIRDDADPPADFAAQRAFTPWTSAWNVIGMPAVSLPWAWTDGAAGAGLPIGAKLAARPAEEELLLSLAAQLERGQAERGRAWGEVHPPGW